MILWNCGAPSNAPQAAATAAAAPAGQAAQSVPQVASGLVGCSEMQFSQLLLAVSKHVVTTRATAIINNSPAPSNLSHSVTTTTIISKVNSDNQHDTSSSIRFL